MLKFLKEKKEQKEQRTKESLYKTKENNEQQKSWSAHKKTYSTSKPLPSLHMQRFFSTSKCQASQNKHKTKRTQRSWNSSSRDKSKLNKTDNNHPRLCPTTKIRTRKRKLWTLTPHQPKATTPQPILHISKQGLHLTKTRNTLSQRKKHAVPQLPKTKGRAHRFSKRNT